MNPEQLNELWTEYQGSKQQPDVNALWNEYQASKTEAPLEATPQGYQAGIGRTTLDQGLQGATFGLGDEISDFIGSNLAKAYGGGQAIIGSLTDDQDMYNAGKDLLNADTYGIGREQSKERLAAQMEQRPALSMGSQLAGALITGGAGASTKAGTAVANSLRTGSTAVRIGKGALAGATSGGLYGFGAGEGGFDNRLESAGENALLGAALGGAVPAVGAAVKSTASNLKNVYKGIRARDVEALEAAGNAIKQSSSNAYQAMRDAGAIISRPRAVNISNNVEKAIKSDGKLNAGLHGNTLSVLEDFKQAARQQDFTLEELDQWRQLFGEVAGNYNDKINARKASIAIDAIDDAVEKLAKIDIEGGKTEAIAALNQGRSEWRRMRKFNAITDIVKKSEGDANYIKRELKKIVTDPKKSRGFTPEERKALQEAAKLNATEGILKSLGKFGFDIGAATRLGNTALPVGGIIMGQPGLTAAGTVARQGQKYLARGKVEELLNIIEQGGNVSAQQISQLPPNQAVQLLNKIRQPKGSRLALSTPAQAEFSSRGGQ